MKNVTAVLASCTRRRVSSLQKVVVGVSLATGIGSAFADGVDVSATVAALTAAVTTVSSIGVAALSIVVAVKIFKFVRGSM